MSFQKRVCEMSLQFELLGSRLRCQIWVCNFILQFELPGVQGSFSKMVVRIEVVFFPELVFNNDLEKRACKWTCQSSKMSFQKWVCKSSCRISITSFQTGGCELICQIPKLSCQTWVCQMRLQIEVADFQNEFSNVRVQVELFDFRASVQGCCCTIGFAHWVATFHGWVFQSEFSKLGPDFQHEFSNVILQREFAIWVARFSDLVFRVGFVNECCKFSCQICRMSF